MALGFTTKILARIAAWTAAKSAPLPKYRWGYFSGPVRTEWLPDGRHQKLLESVTYTDPNGRAWVAPAGSVTDGASIPKIAWSFVGPFEGKYRDAAVIHDVFCVTKAASWQDVHEMFFHAMICCGVSEIQAAFMFLCVWRYGPRWLPAKASHLLGLGISAEAIADAAGPRQRPSAADLNRCWDAVERLLKDQGRATVDDLKTLGGKR
jgi:hypothetical protein